MLSAIQELADSRADEGQEYLATLLLSCAYSFDSLRLIGFCTVILFAMSIGFNRQQSLLDSPNSYKLNNLKRRCISSGKLEAAILAIKVS